MSGNPSQDLVRRVQTPEVREQLKMALPPSVTVDRFVRVVTSALIANPAIADMEHNSVLRAMVQAAGAGLIPDGKQAALVPRDGKATFVPMIQGFRDIAAEHGWTLRTAVVYAEDHFEHAVVDGEEKINHVPVRPGAERGQLIAAYAIAKHRDGRKLMCVLHPEDIALRRASASTKKVWDGPHVAAMWEKSAGRDLFGQLGLGELDERAQRVLAAEHADAADAARMIYGTEIQDPPAAVVGALPPAEDSGPPRASGGAGDAAATSDGSAVGVTAEAAAGAESSPQQAAAAMTPAAAAPGVEPDPPGSSPFVAPAGVPDDDAVVAAQQAAQMVVPIGKWQGMTLAEVQAAGDQGEGWLRYALTTFDEATGTTKSADPKYPAGLFVEALRAFCRVYLPQVYEEVAAA